MHSQRGRYDPGTGFPLAQVSPKSASSRQMQERPWEFCRESRKRAELPLLLLKLCRRCSGVRAAPPPWPEQPPPSLECEGTSIGGAPGAYDGLVTATDCRCAFCALAQRGKERTFPGSSPRHCFPTQKIRAPALRAAIYCGKHRIRAPRPGQGALFERPATHSLVTATGSLWHSGTQQAQLFHSQSGSGRHSEVITTWLRGVQKLPTTCTPRKTTRKLTPQYPS